MIDAIHKAANGKGITRLCHFTPSRNLVHIATDPQGLLATEHLRGDEKAVFYPTDTRRYDGFEDHVCCSIEYPNAWYFWVAKKKAKEQSRLFRDWVVLFIKPDYLWAAGTLFCPWNAATNSGRDVRGGIEAFEAMFAASVTGRTAFKQTDERPDSLPTDMQAEVLIPDRVVREDLLGICVPNETQAKSEAACLEILNVQIPRIRFAPDLFKAPRLKEILCSGSLPIETEYQGDRDG